MGEKWAEIRADYFREDYIGLYYLCNAVLSKTVWYITVGLIWTILVLGVVYGYVIGLPEQINQTLLIALGCAMLLAGIYISLYPKLTRSLARKQVELEYQSGKRKDNQKHIIFEKQGIVVDSFGKTRFFPWKEVVKIKMDQEHLVLLFTNQTPILLIRKALTEQKEEELVRRCVNVRKVIQYP